ncbi:uncharacterized mitochondrial protein-like protein [Tanacetum coccineum]
MKTQKPLLKDEDGEEVDVHMYRSMIGSLTYLTSSRPDIMFTVYACARYQVNLQNCLFACFLSQEEPKKVIYALKDPNWIEAMQEELLQFKLQEVWTLVELPNGKELLALNGIEAIRLFLAYASFKDFMVYQMDVKSVFLYGKIEEEVYMSSMGELTFFLGLQVMQKKDGIFISQDKYVGEILKKFRFTKVKTASTPMETQKPLLKDEDGKEVDVHMYRSMIGSLMYLTSSRPDIMFAVCACARYQVNPKVSHLHAMKRIFRLISWQCKKQTVVANSITEAEYVAASSCCGQVLWIQNQLLDYGFAYKSFRYRVFGLELKLMLLGINLLLLLEVNAARHNLLLLLEVNAARHNLLLLLKVNAARHKLTTAGER